MVERYNQPGLPSLVVGTPGVDPSAGVAAGAVAKASRESTAGAFQYANSRIDQAKGLYNQAGSDFAAAGTHAQNAIAQINHARMLGQVGAAAQRNMQNSLLASNAKLDQQTMIDGVVGQAKAKALAGNNPYSAADDFTKNVIPKVLQQVKQQYPDEHTQKVMLPQINSMLEAGRGDLQSWAPKAVNEQIDGQLKLTPQKITGAIGNIDPSLPLTDQLSTFHKIMADGMAAYDDLKKQSAIFPGKSAEVDAASLNLKALAGKQFAQNGISSIPDNEAGLMQYDQWKRVVEHSEKFQLQISGSDRASLLSQLNTQKQQSIKTQVDSIQSDTQISIANLKVQQAHLAENFENPKVREQIVAGMHDTLTNLEMQLKQAQGQTAVPGSPEESIKKQKLLSISQQIGTLLGGEKQGLQEKNGYEALQRNLVSFSHSMTTFAQGQTKFIQGQLQFQQGQTKFAQGQEDRLAKTGKIEAVTNYNGQMQGFYTNNTKVLGMPLGPERLKAAQDQASGMMATAENAFHSGAINANQFQSVTKQAQDLIHLSEYKHSDGFLGWGAGNKPVAKPQDKINAAMDAAKKTAQASAAAQRDIGTIQTMFKMVPHMTTNDHESAAVQKYVNTHGPELINKARQKGYTDEQIQQKLPAIISGAVGHYRKGELH